MTLFNAPSVAAFRLADEAGATLQTPSLVRNFPEAGTDRFLRTVPVPATPFSIVMHATDGGGNPIQRQFSTVYRAQTVGVRVDAGAEDTVAAGSSTTFSFAIANTGTVPATFSIGVVTSEGSVRNLTPTVVTLAGGATAPANFVLDVPSDVPDGTAITVRLTATHVGDATRFNTAALVLRVSTVLDVDTDGVPDDADNCVTVSNPDQSNTDGDAFGNACDEDDDNDSVLDAADNCAVAVNADHADFDRDRTGDACDAATGPPVDNEQCKNEGVASTCRGHSRTRASAWRM